MPPKRKKFVRWSSGAEDDAAGIVSTITADNPGAAQRWKDGLQRKVEVLEFFPHLGTAYPFQRRVRFLKYRRYLILYSVHRRHVTIRAVVAGERRFEPGWLKRD